MLNSAHLRAAGRLLKRTLRPVPKIAAGPGQGLRFDVGPASGFFLTGRVEEPVQQVLQALLRPGNVFYDIGGNVGFFTLLGARLVGSTGAVYAFEPVPGNAVAIQRNASLNRATHVTVIQVALSDESGSRRLLLAEHAGGAVLESVGSPPPDVAGSIEVEAWPLDRLATERQLARPDVVKIDVEGAELNVLRGMQGMLRGDRPAIVLELDSADRSRCEAKIDECRAFLDPFGYRFETLSNSYDDAVWFVRHIVARPVREA
jgi:FkbM family methyltransferase